MSSYPVNLRLGGKRCLVVGGGPVAARKASGLLNAGALVTVVAPDAVADLAEDPDIRWHQRPYQRGEVASYRLAITATNDPAVNAQVFTDGEAAGVFVNSADDPDNCAFTLPAVARQGHLSVAISTDGKSPALAKWLRQRTERELGPHIDALLQLLAETRSAVRDQSGTSEISGWLAALDGGVIELVEQGNVLGARALLHQFLDLDLEAVQ